MKERGGGEAGGGETDYMGQGLNKISKKIAYALEIKL